MRKLPVICQCSNDIEHCGTSLGTEQFTRRRRSSVVAISLANPNQRPTTRPTGQPAIRRVSDDLGLPLRRSPSPKRKILSSLGPAAATPLRPLSPVKRPPLDPLHPFSREDVTLLPSRIPTHGNIPSPIPESPLSPYPSPQFFPPGSKPAKNSSALPPSFNTSTPLAAHPQAGGGGTLLPPKRSYSASSATGPDSFHQRRLPIRYNISVCTFHIPYSTKSFRVFQGSTSNLENPAREKFCIIMHIYGTCDIYGIRGKCFRK